MGGPRSPAKDEDRRWKVGARRLVASGRHRARARVVVAREALAVAGGRARRRRARTARRRATAGRAAAARARLVSTASRRSAVGGAGAKPKERLAVVSGRILSKAGETSSGGERRTGRSQWRTAGGPAVVRVDGRRAWRRSNGGQESRRSSRQPVGWNRSCSGRDAGRIGRMQQAAEGR